MIGLLVAVAAAGKWDGLEADIVAEVVMDAPAPIIREQFEDLTTLELYSDDCVSELQIGEPAAHQGAPFRVRYHAGPWSRLAEGVISDVGHQYVDWEHTGRYGFTTRYQFESIPDGEGTRVTMTTFLEAPVWPFKGLFFKRVRPGWADCHHELLLAVSERVAGRRVVPDDPMERPEPAEDEALQGTEEAG